MFILITYDVNTEDKVGKARLRKVAKICKDYGQRVQNSVFECMLEPAQYRLLQSQLKDIIDTQKDSLRFYNLGNNYEKRVEHMGKENILKQDQVLIF